MPPAPYPAYDVRKVIHSIKNPSPDLVHVFAHRASRCLGSTTENSFSAVAAAARGGYEGIEIDIRLTKDKQVVVFHDAGMGRLTDVKPPAGESYHNPFTGKGYSPLVKDTNWFGEMEHLHLRDDSGNVTSEHPILLKELLEFIHDEGINILVQIDVKDLDAMAYGYDVIAQYANAAGVPATEWCLWKPKGEVFPTPEVWERQEWVQKALSRGDAPSFVLFYEHEDDTVLPSIKAWESCSYLINYELHVPRPGGTLQPALDYILAQGKGVGSWYIGGDFARRHYVGDGQMSWDDSSLRDQILASGPSVKIMYREGHGVVAAGGVLGRPPTDTDHDTRVNLAALIQQGWNYIVAQPGEDVPVVQGREVALYAVDVCADVGVGEVEPWV
ncbi:hypothetical protein Q8F55_007330 [Vanrija albida]|uniref:GP-PDE domain-containing protein n=1 Tax=Vanrija albida TaxID=181172 RepID=A0ABR3PZN0_9TREE